MGHLRASPQGKNGLSGKCANECAAAAPERSCDHRMPTVYEGLKYLKDAAVGEQGARNEPKGLLRITELQEGGRASVCDRVLHAARQGCPSRPPRRPAKVC